ncbi:MAG: acylphosphatase [Eubacterium sp.]|nr:acylphosphatase [Eubacterium sp.]
MVVRKHMLISGDVQGVGFRYRARYAAIEYGLTGYVRNLYNGKVELEVQGERELISRFLESVNAGRYIHIDDIETKNMEVDSDEKSFKVLHDGY